MKSRPFHQLLLTLALGCCWSCRSTPAAGDSGKADLEIAALTPANHAHFEQQVLSQFGNRNNARIRYLRNLESNNLRLHFYQRIFQEHAVKPDLLEIDVVWPAILADELIDLKPYLGDEVARFAPELIDSFTVGGRLIALPLYADIGVLYYRPALLRRYGFHAPPRTWTELEAMARGIQTGERRRGNKNFWGFSWQGGAFEGLACNAVEWRLSEGAANLVEPDRSIHARDPIALRTVTRALGWINTISPPGEFAYREPDSENLWNAGNVAFIRGWATAYGRLEPKPGGDPEHFAVAPLPGGANGSKGTLGGLGVGISKYSRNRAFAVQALDALTSEASDLQRVFETDSLPVRLAVRERSEVRNRSQLYAVLGQLMAGAVVRPSTVTSIHYDQVSGAYTRALNSVFRRRLPPEVAMANLETQLSQITGFAAR